MLLLFYLHLLCILVAAQTARQARAHLGVLALFVALVRILALLVGGRGLLIHHLKLGEHEHDLPVLFVQRIAGLAHEGADAHRQVGHEVDDPVAGPGELVGRDRELFVGTDLLLELRDEPAQGSAGQKARERHDLVHALARDHIVERDQPMQQLAQIYGTNWTQVFAAASPPKLMPLGLAYRESDDSLFVAGQLAPGANSVMGGLERWIFDQQTWHQVTSDGKPPCVDHYGASAQDVKRGVIVFFGGYCTGAAVEWDGSAWKEVTPNPSPANRGNEAGRPVMTYDPEHHVTLMYGGTAKGTYFNDLWAWDGVAWKQLA